MNGWINISRSVVLLGVRAVVKVVERSDKESKPQPEKAEVRRKLEDVRRNLLFILYSLWLVLRKNRLLFWGGTITFSALFGASLALITPLWSDWNYLNEKQRLSLGNTRLQNSNIWGNSSQYQVSRPVNILVMGIDPLPGVANTSPKIFTGSSDTMLLLRLNPNDKSIKVLSIPKDSQVVIPEIGLAKISLANATGGPALAARVVSRNLNNVPIDRYVRITTNAFRELVDLLGGVEVFVPQQMSYRDATQKLQIDLAPGWQTLNGHQAQHFAQFRDSSVGDLTRVQRQQSLLKALHHRLTNPSVLPRLPRLTRMMQNYVDTNLSLEEMLALMNFCVELDWENFQMLLLPGNLSSLSQDPSSYWLDFSGMNRVMSEYFGVSSIGVAQQTRSLSTLRIAIQNASGQRNLGDRVAKYLKERGFDKVYVVSDWPDVQRQTEIIVQRGNLEAAADLKKVLGLGNIESNSTGDLESQLTIRVGKDWVDTPLTSEKVIF
jgi:LCP family protein required for cell wall assembly